MKIEKGVKGLENFDIVREISHSVDGLRSFESKVAAEYEAGRIKGPIHLAHGNELQLMTIFSRISPGDFVFAAWRNHYHALLHGVDENFLLSEIIEGRSMGIMCDRPNFVSSSIVGGIIPIALGVALAYHRNEKNKNRVWCFIGDMTYETGLFWEAYKYSRSFNLPLTFIVEDNGKSVTSPTKITWGEKMEPLDGVIWYEYVSKYPHHGTGKWVNF